MYTGFHKEKDRPKFISLALEAEVDVEVDVEPCVVYWKLARLPRKKELWANYLLELVLLSIH